MPFRDWDFTGCPDFADRDFDCEDFDFAGLRLPFLVCFAEFVIENVAVVFVFVRDF